MSTPSRFRAETKYGKSQERKANRNLPVMARVGNGDDTNETVATGRANFYWIRLVNDDNRLTQCYSLIPLSYDDLIYVRRARDRDLSYYEFDKFIQDGDENTAPPTQVHDHHDDTEGGDALNPATITPQTFIVGPDPAPYNTLGEAADAVNAFGPTAANPATIHIQGIVTTETGHITLDDYCNISGEGMSDYESVIGMGDFQLNMATHTSISDVCVKSTSGHTVVWPDLSTGYMHNVHILAAGTTGFLSQGTVSVRAHRVLIQRSGGALAAGFRIDNGAGYVMLDFCEVDGAITDGLDVDRHYVITRFCRFACPGGDDVDVAAGADWWHIKCNWDANNSTIAGTEVPQPDGAVEIRSTAIHGHDSLYPDLGTTTAAQMWGDIYIAAGHDVYSDADTAGLAERGINMWFDPNENFRGAFNWLTTGWAGAPLDGTPDTVDFTTYPDLGWIGDGTTNDEFMRYRSVNWTIDTDYHIVARVGSVTDCEVGIRIDTGDNNDYAQIYVKTAVTGLCSIVKEYQENGAGVTTTTLISDFPIQWYLMALTIVGSSNAIYPYYGIDLPTVAGCAGDLGDIDNWSEPPTRLGIWFTRTGGADVTSRRGLYDWLYTDVPAA